jgi:hypothetical protein
MKKSNPYQGIHAANHPKRMYLRATETPHLSR